MKKSNKIIILVVVLGILLGIFFIINRKKEDVKKTKNDEKVTFLAVGDNLMHERLLKYAQKNGDYDFINYYRNIEKYIKEVDLAFVNQETVLGGTELGIQGYPNFNTPDIMAKNLKEVGFDVVNGATNHALDMGLQGLLHSVDVFKNEKLDYIGLYKSKEDRENINIIEKNGIKIAFLAYNQMTNGHKKPNEYCINSFDEEIIKNDLKKAKEESDIVLVSCHWGEEYQLEANAFQKKFANILAENGADVIIGTHSHTLQNIEKIKRKDGKETLVAYSLGNFISGMMEEDTQLGGMLYFDIVKENGEFTIKNEKLSPLVNHYEASNEKDVYNTREKFTVYKMKDYTDELSQRHGLNGYKGIKIDLKKMKDKVRSILEDNIEIEL